MTGPTHVYIARRPCGCAAGFEVDYADKSTAKGVADFITSGMTIERVTLEDARAVKYVRKCEHDMLADPSFRKQMRDRLVELGVPPEAIADDGRAKFTV